jgi:hypothetical protein
MNLQKLKHAELKFLARYPGGFADPGLAPIRKKHNVDQLTEFAQANLGPGACHRPEHVADTLVRIIGRSSMVSRFEKPKFRDFVRSLNSHEKEHLALAIEKRLHGRSKRDGFDEMVGMLSHYKIAKWSIVSVVPFYCAPRREAFVKPTTAKGILTYLEIEEPQYTPRPSWEFYSAYRKLLQQIKREIDPSLSPNYAALTGFMMSVM